MISRSKWEKRRLERDKSSRPSNKEVIREKGKEARGQRVKKEVLRNTVFSEADQENQLFWKAEYQMYWFWNVMLLSVLFILLFKSQTLNKLTLVARMYYSCCFQIQFWQAQPFPMVFLLAFIQYSLGLEIFSALSNSIRWHNKS